MANSTAQITCQICGAKTHAIKPHLKKEHPEYTLERYSEEFPEAPLLSEYAVLQIENRKREKVSASDSVKEVEKTEDEGTYLHQVLASEKTLKDQFKSKTGDPIPVKLPESDEAWNHLIPCKKSFENYIPQPEETKTAVMGLELNIPTMIWGHAGTGKSTLWEFIASSFNWPTVRVQHTGNMEEAHVTGQYTVQGEEMVWVPGLLQQAMKYGWLYLADEYDFAIPEVLSCYQAVLEGKPLVVKEAPEEWRIVEPHPNFRFCATGNTNGSGDETGLYGGTVVGNSANYERFGIVIYLGYMDQKVEIDMVHKNGGVKMSEAKLIVEFATKCREAFLNKETSNTLGPRVLLNIAKVGFAKGSFKKGAELAFINRLSDMDKEKVLGFAQRIFGD